VCDDLGAIVLNFQVDAFDWNFSDRNIGGTDDREKLSSNHPSHHCQDPFHGWSSMAQKIQAKKCSLMA
jgi:hypothetical protein